MYLRVAVFYILKSTLLSGRPLLRRRRSRVLKGSPRLTCLIIYLYLLSYNQTDSDVGADGCVDDRSSELDEGELPVVKGITRLSRNRISRFCSIRVFLGLKAYSPFVACNFCSKDISTIPCPLVYSCSPRNYLRVRTP